MEAPTQSAEQEKQRVALSSVVAAVFLTGIKMVVGLLTNSLGILSEAAHSGLDLIAAGVTYFAVRVSDLPPDSEHTYGHGKVENLSALIETLLLLATCIWIVYEAVTRLFEPVQVEATLWSFVVMGLSIVIDISRSRALMKVAKKYDSQALEADALHFSTDVWSSSVVILGLMAVWAAQWLEANTALSVAWLYRADSAAALGVSAIVIYVSVKLGRRTIDALLDTTEKETTEQIEKVVGEIPGVLAVSRVRVRRSGPSTFVDLTLAAPRSASFEEAHQAAREAEMAVGRLFPRADVMVHVDPVVEDESSLVEQIRSAAARQGVGVHDIRAYNVQGRLSLELHLEVPEDLTLEQAHEKASAFESFVRSEVAGLGEIVTHIEPVGDAETHRPAIRTSSEGIRRALALLAERMPEVRDCHNLSIHRNGDALSLSFHCLIDPELPVGEAHRITEELETLLRARLPELGRVVIHAEPFEEGDEAGG